MARWIFNVPTFTPTAIGDTSNITDDLHMSIIGGTTTQLVNILEVFLGGQGTIGAVAVMLLARHSQVGTGSLTRNTGSTNTQYHPSTAAWVDPIAPIAFARAATNKPQSSATLKLINLSFNAFGGLVRKTWNPGEGPAILGNTASLGEVGVHGWTGTAAGCAMGGHIEYEPL